MALDDRILDVGPEARVGKRRLPLFRQIISSTMTRRLRSFIHKIGHVAPRKLGDAELEARGRHEDDPSVLSFERQDHVQILQRVGRARVHEIADRGRSHHKAVVFEKISLIAFREVSSSVECSRNRVVVPHIAVLPP